MRSRDALLARARADLRDSQTVALPARSGEHRGGLLGRLLGPVFADIPLAPEAAERLRRAQADGIVVHVLRSHRLLDPVFILYALERLGLQKPAWMHDHYASLRPPTVAELVEAIRSGEPALLFLRRPRTLVSPNSAYSERHVEALLAAQRELERPILLLPETLLWDRRAGGIRRTIVDVVFGDRESPGRLREMLGFLIHAGDARFHVGAPVDLQAVLEREKGRTDRVIAKKIRWAILHHLAREEAIRAGPAHRSQARMRQTVLKDPQVQKIIRAAEPSEGGPKALEAKADEMLSKLAADMRYGWIRVLDAILDRIWNDIFDGIVVDHAGLAKVWAAARGGPIVLVPSHRSHADYLVLSQVFFRAGMMPPHIAAGDNLAFPPIGSIFRRSGAFFIRRSFGGDRLYTAVMGAYVKRLLREGHALEFFIEGGRSRNGKLLAPKLGMLGMAVSPVLDAALADLSFVPVSIGYDKIIEAGSYARELEGGAKRKEDLGALLSTRKVLRSRYGRVYVDFDEPISLRAFAAARGIEIANASEAEGEPHTRRNLISQLAHRITYGISRVTRVTPTGVAALVLLAQARRGMAEGELVTRAARMLDLLAALGARTSPVLEPATRSDALKEALGRMAQDGLIQMTPAPDGETIYRLDDAGRRALDYYKNTTLHFFVPHAILSLAALSASEAVVAEPVLRARARRLSRLLKLEFSFRVDDFDHNFDATAAVLASRRVIERRDAGWCIPLNGRDAAIELAGLIAVFLEAYRLAAETIEVLMGARLADKALIAEALLRAQRQVLEGRITRAEAASTITLHNAVRLFVELGLITSSEAGTLGIVADTGAARAELIAELDGYLAAVR